VQRRPEDVVRPAAEQVAHVDDNGPWNRGRWMVYACVRVLDLEPTNRVLVKQRHRLPRKEAAPTVSLGHSDKLARGVTDAIV
jgi:hypothetical protein